MKKNALESTAFQRKTGLTCCWWFRNPSNQLRLVVSIVYRDLYICGGAGLLMEEIQRSPPGMYKTLEILNYQPQLVVDSFHQQYHWISGFFIHQDFWTWKVLGTQTTRNHSNPVPRTERFDLGKAWQSQKHFIGWGFFVSTCHFAWVSDALFNPTSAETMKPWNHQKPKWNFPSPNAEGISLMVMMAKQKSSNSNF